jgi:mitochondrial protein import protein ZIM17
MYMVFTCGNCETRAVKGFSKRSYEEGVVLVQCPGCEKRHVVADHLGWFGPEKNIEEILASKGEPVTLVTDVELDGVGGLSLDAVLGAPRSSNGKNEDS